MKAIIPTIAIFAMLMAGTVGSSMAAPVSDIAPERSVPNYGTVLNRVSEGRGGDGIKIGVVWDMQNKLYAVVKYYNGFFVGTIHAFPGGEFKSNEKFWGLYNDGEWMGFHGKMSKENFVFGEYRFLENWPNFGWVLTNLQGGSIYGYGYHMFE